MAQPGAAVARLTSPALLARLFTIRTLAWIAIAATSIAAGSAGRVPAAPAYVFGAACLILAIGDGLWALQSWGLAPIATARIDDDGIAHVRVVAIKPAPRIRVKVTKKGDIPSTTRRSVIGGAGVAQGWPTHELLVLTSPDGADLVRLVPHGVVSWTFAERPNAGNAADAESA